MEKERTGLQERPETKRSVNDYLISMLYCLSGTMGVLMQSVENRAKFSTTAGDLKHEKKRAFREMMKAIDTFSRNFEYLQEDTWQATGTAKHFDEIRHEHNLIARLLLLYLDRFSSKTRNQCELEDWMRTHGESIGAIDDSVLDDFRMRG